jgi:tetratricopeptide (TPR) repeat protein
MPSSAVSVLGASEGMAEHRAYLASCGIFLLIGSVAGLETSAARASPGILGPLARVAFVVVLLAFSARTVLRNLIWRDPIALWQEASVLSPGHWLPRTVLGESFHRAGQHAEAAAAFEAALQMRPRESELYLKLAICLAELGRTDDATAAIERLRRIDPVSPVVSTGLGAIALITGDPDKARAHFLETLDKHPSDVMALQWLAVLEEDVVANPAEAIRRCEEIQRIAPGRLSTSECLERNRSR